GHLPGREPFEHQPPGADVAGDGRHGRVPAEVEGGLRLLRAVAGKAVAFQERLHPRCKAAFERLRRGIPRTTPGRAGEADNCQGEDKAYFGIPGHEKPCLAGMARGDASRGRVGLRQAILLHLGAGATILPPRPLTAPPCPPRRTLAATAASPRAM